MTKPWNLSNVITDVSCKYGAPMGRANIGSHPHLITRGNNCRVCKVDQTKVYDKHVALYDGYDKGGAYWGIGSALRVRFTADLSYIKFYRA